MRSELLDGDEFPSHYEERVRARRAARGTLLTCGVYLADGVCHVAPLDSEAGQRLLDAGAVHVADVTFDGAPVAALTGGAGQAGEVVPVPARHAARAGEKGLGRN
ncbi:MAG TPA: hypothetical protein VF665_18695 [Longimicrobium sp.]|jgi:hypothetical protein|uniref:hypothetical protein n=1 Tax=Longimicrobium sp. TaxID=2029185 RepID=UPI002ED90AE9